MSFTVAVVGATGAVGREMVRILEQRSFPVKKLVPLASPRSAGTTMKFRGEDVPVQVVCAEAFQGVDVALFSAGASPSKEWAPIAAKAGAIVIDNSSAWRMDPECPLVVPEVNAHHLKSIPKGIVANPNCSTIQMLVALKPLHEAARIEHIVVATYQAASGKGHEAVTELVAQAKAIVEGKEPEAKVFPGVLAFNTLCDWKAGENDYSEEELKMVHETRKMLDDETIGVSPTTVRVPVVNGHSESVWVRFKRPLTAREAKEILGKAPGLVLHGDAYAPGKHPQPRTVTGDDAVHVGRVRDDLAVPGALNLWIVGDNLRKGAALNAVQIAEVLFAKK